MSAGVRATEATFGEWLANRCEQRDAGYSSVCWVWKLYISPRGYGSTSLPAFLGDYTKGYRVHRLAYEMLVAPIPDGLVIDHLCRNRACCNPEHLEVVTTAVNNSRRRNALCRQGHEFTPDNVLMRDGKRRCLTCERRRQRAYNQARRPRVRKDLSGDVTHASPNCGGSANSECAAPVCVGGAH